METGTLPAELLTYIPAIKRKPETVSNLFYLGLFVQNRLAAERAVLVLLKLAGYILAVLIGCIVLSLAIGTLQCDDFDC